MRIVIVGGGILGLATARQLAADHDVVVLEKEDGPARHQTGHNSGVAHAGLYYAPGSLKARLCRRGIGLLRDFCRGYGIAYVECGKVVAATTAGELPGLRAIAERAQENGVPGLRWLEGGELTAVEPHLSAVAGLHSPQTAIVDFPGVALALAGELRASGGELRTRAGVARVTVANGRPRVELTSGESVDADRVVVCAGLQVDRLAHASGEPAQPRIIPFRGEYWQLAPGRTGLVRGLIYPVPDPSLPFLGVHLTKRVDGAVWLGPSAILSLSREGYGRPGVNARDLYDTLAWPGAARMMRRHWRAGLGELRRAASKRAFITELRRYVPELSDADCIRAPAGIRAQAVDRDGALVDDFRLSAPGPVVWVRNAPSPAATSSLAIAEELAERALA